MSAPSFTHAHFYYSSVQAQRIPRINQSFITGGAALWRRRDKNKRKKRKKKKESRKRNENERTIISGMAWHCTGSGTGHKITMDPAMLDRHLRASLGRQACFKCAVREVMEQFLLQVVLDKRLNNILYSVVLTTPVVSCSLLASVKPVNEQKFAGHYRRDFRDPFVRCLRRSTSCIGI